MSDAAVRPPFLEVAAVDLFLVALPLLEPFAASHGTETTRRVILVRLTGPDGLEGWGECPTLSAPTYTGEDTDGAWRVLRVGLAHDMVWGRGSAAAPQPAGAAHPMATAAVDEAVHDLFLRRLGVSLAALLGADADAVVSRAVIGRQPTLEDVVSRVARKVDAGHPAVKLKVGPGWDRQPVDAVRSTWPDLDVAADANGAYLDLADPALRALDAAGLTYLEQPLPATEPTAVVAAVDGLDTPVALDESIAGPAELDWFLAAARRPFLVNVKPARVGGIDPAVAVHDRLLDTDSGGFVGGMLETGVGRAAALAVAALPGFARPTDLGPSSQYFADDVTEPFALQAGGRLPVPTGPGIGVRPRPDRLAEVTEAHVRIER